MDYIKYPEKYVYLNEGYIFCDDLQPVTREYYAMCQAPASDALLKASIPDKIGQMQLKECCISLPDKMKSKSGKEYSIAKAAKIYSELYALWVNSRPKEMKAVSLLSLPRYVPDEQGPLLLINNACPVTVEFEMPGENAEGICFCFGYMDGSPEEGYEMSVLRVNEGKRNWPGIRIVSRQQFERMVKIAGL